MKNSRVVTPPGYSYFFSSDHPGLPRLCLRDKRLHLVHAPVHHGRKLVPLLFFTFAATIFRSAAIGLPTPARFRNFLLRETRGRVGVPDKRNAKLPIATRLIKPGDGG
jgi:hypothetical protein